MPVPTLYETIDSRQFSTDAASATLTRRFVSVGSDDETDVYAAALLASPAVYDNLLRTDVTATFKGGGVAEVEITYGVPAGDTAAGEEPEEPEAPDPDVTLIDANYSVTTTGGTAHITQSRETREAIALAGAAPNTKKAIGLTREGVDGVDVVAPNCEFSVTVDKTGVTLTAVRTLLRLTGKTNNALWRGFKRGELLCLGFEMQGAGRGRWSVTAKLRFAEDQPNGDPRNVIAPGLTIDNKRGHDYVWCQYELKVVGLNAAPLPIAAFVERVYDEADFTTIGPG